MFNFAIATAIVVVILVLVTSISNHMFKSQFQSAVAESYNQIKNEPVIIVSEESIQNLPSPVKKYLRFTGSVGKPFPQSVKIEFHGEMRGKGKDWFTFDSVQHNFFKHPARLFFMRGKMLGISVPGFHEYQDATAKMKIKLFGLISVVNEKGQWLDKTETVTLFNDMCLYAPWSLIDTRITWEVVDDLTVKAGFKNGSNTVAATLYFDEEGRLINFLSNDRTSIGEMKEYPFSTPVRDYRQVNGRFAPGYGEAIWHYPEGPFVYGKFNLTSIEYLDSLP
jgi:hypothetical protein